MYCRVSSFESKQSKNNINETLGKQPSRTGVTVIGDGMVNTFPFIAKWDIKMKYKLE